MLDVAIRVQQLIVKCLRLIDERLVTLRSSQFVIRCSQVVIRVGIRWIYLFGFFELLHSFGITTLLEQLNTECVLSHTGPTATTEHADNTTKAYEHNRSKIHHARSGSLHSKLSQLSIGLKISLEWMASLEST